MVSMVCVEFSDKFNSFHPIRVFSLAIRRVLDKNNFLFPLIKRLFALYKLVFNGQELYINICVNLNRMPSFEEILRERFSDSTIYSKYIPVVDHGRLWFSFIFRGNEGDTYYRDNMINRYIYRDSVAIDNMYDNNVILHVFYCLV